MTFNVLIEILINSNETFAKSANWVFSAILTFVPMPKER